MSKKRVKINVLRIVLLIAIGLVGCTQIPIREENPNPIERVTASWYGPGFHGRQAADGSIYNQHYLTAAHPNLPFGTQLELKTLDEQRSVIVTVTDRGPYVRGRHLDLSYEAARQLGMIEPGVVNLNAQIVFLPGR